MVEPTGVRGMGWLTDSDGDERGVGGKGVVELGSTSVYMGAGLTVRLPSP